MKSSWSQLPPPATATAGESPYGTGEVVEFWCCTSGTLVCDRLVWYVSETNSREKALLLCTELHMPHWQTSESGFRHSEKMPCRTCQKSCAGPVGLFFLVQKVSLQAVCCLHHAQQGVPASAT